MSTRRLFFALWPNHRQREALRDPIKAALGGIEGEAVARTNWHVTLVFLGSFAEARIAPLMDSVAAIETTPFRLRLDRLEYWARPKIACLLASAVPPPLAALVKALEQAAVEHGHEPENRAYRPHLTIARRARPFPSQPLSQPLLTEWSGFSLLESVSTSRGVQYHPVARD